MKGRDDMNENIEYKARSQFVSVLYRLKKNRLAMLGLAVLLIMAAVALCAGFIADYDKDVIGQDTANRLQGPSAEHWFGTDQFGRDVFARIVYGARISLTMSIIAMLIAVAIGAIIGAIAGFYGGFRDNILMRIMDILLAIPPRSIPYCDNVPVKLRSLQAHRESSKSVSFLHTSLLKTASALPNSLNRTTRTLVAGQSRNRPSNSPAHGLPAPSSS